MSEPEDAPPTVAQTATGESQGQAYVITLDLRPGAVFHSRYEIIAPLGRGGMGMVFRAHDRVLDETVAIKVLRPDIAQDPRMADRFRSEIKLARKVRHRNVCAIHDYGEDQGLLYISMEMVEGVDLKRTLRDTGALRPEQAFDVAIQIAEGLQAVHDAGIVHRDLKTPNIMIAAGGVARLMDFGVAKRLGEGNITTTGHVVGTPEYMSPEQAQGHTVDGRSDIYALGVVVYEVFTGEVPFRGDTPISTILKHINDAPQLEKAGLPAAVRAVLRRALAKDPAARYATAREMGEALRAARATSASAPAEVESGAVTMVRGRQPSAPPASRRARRTSRALQPWLLVLPAVAVGGGVVVLYGQMHRAAPETPATLVANIPPTTLAPVAAPRPSPSVDIRTAAVPAPTEPPATLPVHVAATPRPHPTPLTAAPTPRATAPTAVPVVAATPPPTPVPAPSAPPSSAPSSASSAPGLLQVVVHPWGEVTVDGRLVGQTPLDRIPLSAGVHRVRVRHPSYEVWEREVTLRSGQIEKVTVDFPAAGVKRQ